MNAAGRLFAEKHVRPRLLGQERGERKLTDLLHLMELVHGREQAVGAGPAEVTAWLAAAVSGESPDNGPEEHQLRLDKDDDAVRVVTVHASKGLEYPVVFAPFLLFGRNEGKDLALYHDLEEDGRLTLDLAPDKDGPGAAQQRLEGLAERLRLAYVALTRARNRCYTAWGALSSRDAGLLTSALHYLFCGRVDPESADVVAALQEAAAAMSSEDAARAAEKLAQVRSSGIVAHPLPKAGEEPYAPVQGQAPELLCRVFTGRVDRRPRISSFTALSAGRGEPEAAARGLDESAVQDPAPLQEPAPHSLFAFPRGALPGIALHAFMEHLDFTLADDEAHVTAQAQACLGDHGFSLEYAPALADMACKVCTTELAPGLRLRDVGPGRRLDELQFTLPLAEITVGALRKVYDAHQGDLGPEVARRVADLRFEEQMGQLTGFMDLVFRHGQRYYLLDWKSNHLGMTPRDYAPEILAQAMIEQCYFLQSHIYAAALDAFLASRLPGYDMEAHFGGVFYLFLRGVDPCAPGCGVYSDRPGQAFLRDLSRTFFPRTGE